VEEISFITHFSDADGARGIDHQLQVFMEVTADLPGERSDCNSAATLIFGGDAQVRNDWVRPGIVLYGSAPDYPARTADDWGLQPAMTLSTKVIGTQTLKAGDTVGYGSTFTADGPMLLGVIACGYADGYPRSCGTGTPVLVNGVRTRLLGRVSMDMICVDLTPVPGAGMGSEVVLWGQSPTTGAVLSIDEVAAAGGTVGYELMCAVAPRVPVVSDEAPPARK
jgi:alanine racemase